MLAPLELIAGALPFIERRTARALPDVQSDAVPAWAAALPLWAGPCWLWIQVGPAHAVRYWQKLALHPVTAGAAPALEHLPPAPPYPMLVLDYQAAPPVPADWWPRLAAALAPGGVLFVCGPAHAPLARQIASAAPNLRPGGWHVVEQGQDCNWHLYPATAAARRLIDTELQPPLSLGAWLAQLRRRWLPEPTRVTCLLIWRTEDPP